MLGGGTVKKPLPPLFFRRGARPFAPVIPPLSIHMQKPTKAVFRPSFVLTSAAAACVLFAQTSHAATVMEWDASSWSGTGAWTDSTAGEQLTNTVGTVTKAVDSTTFAGSGKQITTTVYNGSSGFESDASSLLGGLKEFTISAVIRVGATPGAGAGPAGNGWTYNAVTAFEIGNNNQGEFQFGFDNANKLNGAVGLNGDNFVGGGTVPADQWATVAFILNQDPNNNGTSTEYNLSTYINGVLQGTSGVLTYGGGTGEFIRNSPFGVGFNVVGGGDRRFLTGDIAHLRYDNTALDQATLTADAANYLGTLENVPEPSTGLLALVGAAFAAARRKRR